MARKTKKELEAENIVLHDELRRLKRGISEKKMKLMSEYSARSTDYGPNDFSVIHKKVEFPDQARKSFHRIIRRHTS